MAGTLESLEIEVKHNSSKASDSIYEVTESIRQLGKVLGDVLPQVKSFAGSMKDIGKVKSSSGWGEKQQSKLETPDVSGMQSLLDSLDGSDVDRVSQVLSTMYGDLENLVHVFGDIGRAAREGFSILGSVITPVVNAIKTATSAVIRFAGSLARIAANGVKTAIKGVASSVNGLREKLNKSAPALSNFLSSLKRIAFYRFIRTIIKSITEAFKEGLKNAYEFSEGIAGESHRFAVAMDSMKTASSSMKNQLGAAFIGLLTAIAPIINTIISLITKLANAISQIFAAFTGGTYLKAAEVPQKWGEAAGGAAKAAKEWKNQLMGFDEINKLEAPSDGGGGGSGGVDPMSMFEDSPINEKIKAFVDDFKAAISAGDWQGAGELLGNKINELLPTKEQWEEWGSKLGYGLNGAIQTFYYMLKTIDFTAIGQGIASFINGALEEIDFEILGRTLVRKVTAALDFLLGFLGTLDWGLIGNSIFNFLIGALSEANEWLASKDWEQIGINLFNKFKELIESINFEELARAFFTFLGLAFGAIVQILDEFFESAWQSIKDYFKGKMEETGGDAWEGFKKGISDAIKDVSSWVQTNMIDPFVKAVKTSLGIHSPSTVFEAIGKDVVAGFKSGFDQKWKEFRSTVDGMINTFVTFVRNAVSQIGEMLNGIGSGIGGRLSGFLGGIGLPKFASGGFPEDGLFFANHGEMVGQFSNGKTAVANNQEIVEGIKQGVIEAMLTVGSSQGGGKQTEFVFNLNGREFARAIYNDQNAVQREHGVSYLASS